MKKLIYSILCIVLISFMNIDAVSAVANICEYDFDTEKEGNELIVTFDESGTPRINQEFFNDFQMPWILNALVNVNLGDVKPTNNLADGQPMELLGSCPSNLYICKYEETSFNTGLANLFSDEHGFINVLNQVHIFYSANEMNSDSTLKDLPNGEVSIGSELWNNTVGAAESCWFVDEDTHWALIPLNGILSMLCADAGFLGTVIKSNWTAENFYVKYKDCRNAAYTGKGPSYNLSCPNLNVYLGRFQTAINEYEDCPENNAACRSQKITNVNTQEDLIRSYCSSIMNSYSYDAGNEQDCLDACIQINKKIREAKQSAGILKSANSDCGFSGRLIVWISNIMRWIKYILPVGVIILGIIDFIKAIGADKDDEIKKAQGRFVRRLISAALVFIIPLIIEFVLDIMGFGYDSCSLF